jgi:hypothetical protein
MNQPDATFHAARRLDRYIADRIRVNPAADGLRVHQRTTDWKNHHLATLAWSDADARYTITLRDGAVLYAATRQAALLTVIATAH